ncbi:MAG: hypothetical protein GDA50_04085 [Alphaproteobacteria bacterium GM202ARS2]|nr:hypothetical protein [Alphaproteobacteria bacterium GM202ARS2]
MKATITSTTEIVDIDGSQHMARVWEGVSEKGIHFTAYVSLVQVKRSDDCDEFDRELQEHKRPSTETRIAMMQRIQG